MSQKPANNPAPEVSCSIRIGSSLKTLFAGPASLHGQIRSQITEKLVALLEILGVPGKVVVTIDSVDAATAGNRFLSIFVNGNPCLYPDVLLQLIHSYVTGTALDPNMGPEQIPDWLNGLSENGKAGHESIGEFFGLACLEVVSRQPATILGYEQAVAYCLSLPSPTEADPSIAWPPDANWLWPILQGVLDLRISIADKQMVADVVNQNLQLGRVQQDVIEDLIEFLRPDVVEIQVPEEYLRQLVLDDASNEHDWFVRMRDDWFSSLGIHYPRFHFTTVKNLKPNSCAIKLNHLTTLPYIVLAANECVTNAEASDLKRLDIESRATINPLTGAPCRIIELQDKSAAEDAGLDTFNQMTYVVLTLAIALKEYGDCFIDRQYVSRELDKLKTVFPKLAEAVRAMIPLEETTRVLRSLVAEDICVRDLRSILESQLDYAYSVADSVRGSNEAGNDAATVTSFVRLGLKCQITHKHAPEKILLAHLLDPEIEELLSANEATGSREAQETHLDEVKRNRILAAVQALTDDLTGTYSPPVIVNTLHGRHRLREIIAKQFPRVSVLAYQEISPHVALKLISN